jgi:nucleoside-diphosphate-sugar epimerase
VELARKSFAVIGGAGFIGSHVTDQLLQADAREIIVFDDLRRGRLANLADAIRDQRVRFVEGSITDRAKVGAVIESVDGVFLLAALWLDECARDPRAAWEVNVLGSWNVIEACRDSGRPRIVFSSSASVYGNAVTIPMTEDHPLANRTVYGATKIAVEQMLRAAAAGWDQRYVALRYMNVYGPRMDDRGAYVSVVVRIMDRLDKGEPPIIHGDGSQTFDFVHVHDAARANLLAMASDCTDELVNIGSGVGTSIDKLARQLISMFGSRVQPVYEPDARDLVTRRVGSTEKSRVLLGFESRIGLSAGLSSYVRWRSDNSAEALGQPKNTGTGKGRIDGLANS